jgi:hypothetical protein
MLQKSWFLKFAVGGQEVPKDSTLFGMLIDDLAKTRASKFLKQYAERTAIIYKEAESRSFGDEAVHEAYKPYHCGQTRFTLHQSMFLNLANDCGIGWEVARSPFNGFPSAVVRIGRFYFTDHYSPHSDEITCLNPSLMRQQSAAVNLTLTQGSLFERSFDDCKLTTADNIYGNFIHSCRGQGSDFALYGSIRIAIPCAANPQSAADAQRMLQFVESHKLSDVMAGVLAKETESAARPSVKVATPKLKKVE